MEPAHSAAENRVPIEIARLEARGRFVGAIVENNRRPDAVAAVAVHGCHVGSGDAVVLKPTVDRSDAHGAHALGDQITDRIVDHRRDDAGFQPETIGEIGRDVVLAAAHVYFAFGGFAEWNDARVEAVD